MSKSKLTAEQLKKSRKDAAVKGAETRAKKKQQEAAELKAAAPAAIEKAEAARAEKLAGEKQYKIVGGAVTLTGRRVGTLGQVHPASSFIEANIAELVKGGYITLFSEPEADEPEADEPEADEPEADEPEADEPEADEPKTE